MNRLESLHDRVHSLIIDKYNQDRIPSKNKAYFAYFLDKHINERGKKRFIDTLIEDLKKEESILVKSILGLIEDKKYLQPEDIENNFLTNTMDSLAPNRDLIQLYFITKYSLSNGFTEITDKISKLDLLTLDVPNFKSKAIQISIMKELKKDPQFPNIDYSKCMIEELIMLLWLNVYYYTNSTSEREKLLNNLSNLLYDTTIEDLNQIDLIFLDATLKEISSKLVARTEEEYKGEIEKKGKINGTIYRILLVIFPVLFTIIMYNYFLRNLNNIIFPLIILNSSVVLYEILSIFELYIDLPSKIDNIKSTLPGKIIWVIITVIAIIISLVI
ncbi:MAG: hypothetical protein ACOC5T_01320 [Elusimicrobiota bacterium]